ncbi:MAG: hypothetical protein WB789_09020 [Thermoplasmata archaeon]
MSRSIVEAGDRYRPEVFGRRGTTRLWVLGALAVPAALTGLVFLTLH